MRTFTKSEMALMASKQFSALISAGWTPSALRAAGWTPSALRAAGWTPSDLRAAGWTPSDLRAAGWTPSALRAAGWTPSDLRAAGLTPSALISAGWTPSALISAGWTPSDLISAGWTPSDLRAAGWTPSDLRAAGWTPSDLRAAGWTPSDLRAAIGEIPKIENPYSKLFADIQEKKRKFNQKTWGPESAPTPEPNICNTAMCTAGHLVSLAGEDGWKLKERYGFSGAAALIHDVSHPGWPCQDFGPIPDEWALSYIEQMAEHEKNGTVPVGTVTFSEQTDTQSDAT